MESLKRYFYYRYPELGEAKDTDFNYITQKTEINNKERKELIEKQILAVVCHQTTQKT